MKQENSIPRLLSLDVFRGITIVLMILVNSPGNHQVYGWLAHSAWDGCTLADVVFPFFIVIVGMSLVFSLTQAKMQGETFAKLMANVAKRSIYLFLMGLVLNTFLQGPDLTHIRLLGVLQRISLCYFCASVLFLTTTARMQACIAASIVLFYGLIMALFSPAYPLTPTGNLVGYLDRLLVSPARLYTPLFDPEGLLSTLPAIATALIGNVIAEFLLVSCASKKQLHILIAAGLILLSLGGIYSFFCPINKSLWSSSFVLWTGGLALVGFASCFALIEIAQWRAWTKPFQLFGKNAFLVYVLHVVFLKIQAIILIQNQAGELTNLRLYLTNALFGSLSAESASFSYALSYILFWFCILTALSQVRLKDLR